MLVTLLLGAVEAVERVEREGATGFSVLDAEEIARFTPIESARLPAGSAYLITGIDLGGGNRNVTPTTRGSRSSAPGARR
ncbi:MAG: hypothetical protein H0T39_11415 [Actinobacteria bacterium]|nr:hypothetical protein [Actinomycetota bacterium]